MTKERRQRSKSRSCVEGEQGEPIQISQQQHNFCNSKKEGKMCMQHRVTYTASATTTSKAGAVVHSPWAEAVDGVAVEFSSSITATAPAAVLFARCSLSSLERRSGILCCLSADVSSPALGHVGEVLPAVGKVLGV